MRSRFKFFRFRPDFPLSRDDSNKILPWIIGFMVFLACISVIVCINLNQYITGKGFDNANSVIIEVNGNESERASAASQIVAVLHGNNAFKDVSVIPEEKIKSLVEPWVGKIDSASTLPIPTMIEAKVAAGASPNIEEIREQVKSISADSQVDDNAEWMQRLNSFTRSVQLIAFGVVFMIGVVTVCTVILATKTGLKLHADSINILHMVGATDNYIARQFQTNSMMLALKGGLVGALMVIPTLLPLSFLSRKLGFLGLPIFNMSVYSLAPLVLVLLMTGAITFVFARVATFAILKRAA